MKNAQSRKAGPSPQLRDGFKKAAPLREGLQSLSEEPAGRFMVLFSMPSKARDQLLSFLETREKLSRQFGARIDLVKKPRSERISVSARLELETSDRALNLDIEQLVTSRGFCLRLVTQPVQGPDSMETITVDKGGFETVQFTRQKLDAVYVVSENPRSSQSSPERVAAYANALLELAKDLAGPVEESASPPSSSGVSVSSAPSSQVPQRSTLPDLAAASALNTKL